jgi:hypothetical protein
MSATAKRENRPRPLPSYVMPRPWTLYAKSWPNNAANPVLSFVMHVGKIFLWHVEKLCQE